MDAPTKRLTREELYQLRGLLARLRDHEPDLRDFVATWINGVYTVTSVLLDTRLDDSEIRRPA